MTRLARIELLKLTTTRLSYGLLATAAGVSILFAVVFQAARTSAQAAPVTTAAGLTRFTTNTGFALLLAAVLGVTITSGEFRHQTATTTYLAFPQRGRVLLAKACAAAVAGAVFGLTGGLVTTGAGLLFAATSGGHVALGAGTLAGHIAGAAVAAGLLAAAGASLGSLVRGQLGAVIGVFAWAVILEPFIGGFFTSIRPYLPYTAATTLGGANLTTAFFGAGRLAGGPGALPFAAAAALVAGVAFTLMGIAARTTVPRDIT
jgi:ABC-2 type transport system permease protein